MLSSLRKPANDRLCEHRMELKIPMDQTQFVELFQSLYQLSIYPHKVHPDRKISSIYFDDFDLADYADNVAGISNRTKKRIRWYNDDCSMIALENKIKNNRFSTKSIQRLDNPNEYCAQTLEGISAIRAANRNVSNGLLAENLLPVLWVEYDRQYFMLERDIRLTIDLNQSFRRAYPFSMTNSCSSPVFAVAELKFPASIRTEAQRFLRQLPFRVFRHSKYVIGMDTTGV